MITHTPAAITQPSNNQPTSIPTTPTLHPIREVIEVSPMVAPTTDPSLTANWKVYTNEEIGVSFKYPPLFGSINNNEELCWSDISLMREYQHQPCVGIELESVTANGKMTFLVAQSKLFLEHRLGRGAYWGDLSAALSKNAETNVKSYCINYNPLRIACSVSVNSNSVLYAKSIEAVQKRGEPEYDEKAIYYQ
jgi:hypothetical protein